MAETKPTETPADPQVAALAKLRVPFTANQISKLPKPTAKQTQIVKDDFSKGIRCKICGSWHHPDVVHLDYVGHAALTDRLLDVDPHWSWEPVADPASHGLPVAPGGMWIKLSICNVSRYGFGHPDGKTGGDAVKETIGDALRNAAMRFGAALDLWHKGDLHISDDAEGDKVKPPPQAAVQTATAKPTLAERAAKLTATMSGVKTRADLRRAYDLASGLLADLADGGAAGAAMLDKLDKLYQERFEGLPEPEADEVFS